jgi:hypothetical protein
MSLSALVAQYLLQHTLILLSAWPQSHVDFSLDPLAVFSWVVVGTPERRNLNFIVIDDNLCG